MRLKLIGVLFIVTFILFFPYFVYGKIPFQANFMVTFFAPWSTMKFQGWEHGIPNKPIGLDNLNLFYPYKQLSIDLIKKGIVPLWNPYNFAGNALMANFQSAVFYPLNLVYFILPIVDAWSVMVLIQPVLAGIFTYLFLSCFPIRKIAAIFGSLVFAFSGAMIVWMGDHLVFSHTMLWLPLILFAVERRRFGLGVIALSAAILAGFAQPLVYVFAVVIGYSLYRKINSVPMILLSIGIGAIQLLPTWENFLLSPRATSDVSYLYDQFLMPIGHLISFLAPDYLGNPATYNYLGGGYHESMLYIGVAPFLVALLTRKNPITTFFWIVTGVSLVLGLAISRWFYELGVPIISTFVPSRIFFLTSFALSILAAFGYQKLRPKKLFVLSVTYLIVLGIWYVTSAKVPIMQRNLVLPAVFLILIAFLALTKRWIKLGIFVVMIAGQLYFGQKYLSFSERQFVYPNHPVFTFLQQNAGYNRFWTYGEGYINANFATQYRVYSPDGTDALFPARLGELFNATETKGQYAPSQRIDARIARASEGESMLDNPYRLRLLSLTGVKYVTDFSQKTQLPLSLFTPVWNRDNWHIYEYKDALPRAFLTSSYVVETDQQKILDSIFRGEIALTLEEQPGVAHSEIPTGSATIEVYTPNSVTISVHPTADTLLFLSDTYYPGWNAYVDGKKAKIYRANYAFRAIEISQDAHVVEFRYEPATFGWGMGITIASLLLVIMYSKYPAPDSHRYHQ